jgi:hypothetical protein
VISTIARGLNLDLFLRSSQLRYIRYDRDKEDKPGSAPVIEMVFTLTSGFRRSLRTTSAVHAGTATESRTRDNLKTLYPRLPLYSGCNESVDCKAV